MTTPFRIGELTLASTLAWILACAPAFAAEHIVIQKDRAFSAKTLDLKVGDSISFKNEDSFSHNTFSLSDVMSFDLGSYGSGQAKSVTFSKAGKFEIECAIHPDMRMIVNVKP